jgi:putative tricarboxylic transport membrane protein
MGLYGIGEVLAALERKDEDALPRGAISSATLTRADLRASAMPIMRGTAIGTFLGLIPGIGTILPTIASYAAEKGIARDPSRFGRGAIEGVAGPETANNAYANAALVPLFTLGIPASPTIAVLLGAFMMNGLTPGPFLFKEKPDFVWGVIASLYVGNLILVVLNLPLVGIWVKLLKTPRSILFALVLAFTVVGAFVTSNSIFDIGVLLAFGVVGYLFTKMGIPIAPMAFTVILGPLTENALRQALAMSGGELDVLARGWISTGLLVLAAVVLAWSVLAAARRARS